MFRNREEVASILADNLLKYKNDKDTVIVAIPRGGVPLGKVLSDKLHLPLELVLSKKIGHPYHKEFAIGAVTLKDIILSPVASEVPKAYIESETEKVRNILRKRFQMYYGDEMPLNLSGKTVIIVDDGIATGNTLISCVGLIKKQQPKKIVIALPVAPKESLNQIKKMPSVDEVVCLLSPVDFYAVGQFYEDFGQVTDDEVIDILRKYKSSHFVK